MKNLFSFTWGKPGEEQEIHTFKNEGIYYQ